MCVSTKTVCSPGWERGWAFAVCSSHSSKVWGWAVERSTTPGRDHLRSSETDSSECHLSQNLESGSHLERGGGSFVYCQRWAHSFTSFNNKNKPSKRNRPTYKIHKILSTSMFPSEEHSSMHHKPLKASQLLVSLSPPWCGLRHLSACRELVPNMIPSHLPYQRQREGTERTETKKEKGERKNRQIERENCQICTVE